MTTPPNQRVESSAELDEIRMASMDAILDKETYSVQAICSNCGDFHRMRIVKGVKVTSQPCPTCACKQLTIRPRVTS